MFHPVADLRAFLSGRWRIARRISDARLGITGRLMGHAVFTPSPEGLVHDENGDLRFGAHAGPAARRYRLIIDRPSKAEVRHADGSVFHQIDLISGQAEILHQCGSDQYVGRYRVLRDDRFAVTWHVTGPRKDYRLSTLHARLGGADSDE